MTRTLLRHAAVVLATAVTAALASANVGTPAAAAVSAPAQLRGAQLHVLWSSNSSADVDRQLDLLVRLNATAGRVDVAWSSLQDQSRGVINSGYRARLDYLVAGADARGIRLVLTLQETPCWASSAPETLKLACSGAYWDRGVTRYAPTDVADYAWAARWVAERYGSRIAALEVWNEPNYDDGSYATFIAADKAAAYTALVKTAYPAVKAVAPSLPVLAGATAFADVAFLQSLYAEGIRGSYDAISIHPYNEWRAPGAPHPAEWAKYDLVMGTNAVHDAMVAAGDESPIWITELGWPSCAPTGTDRWCVTEAQQADFLARAVPIVRGWSFVRALLVYNLRAKGADPADREASYGLVRLDYTPKPALAALGQAFADAAAGSASPPADTVAPTAPTDVVSSVSTSTVSLTWGASADDVGVAAYDIHRSSTSGFVPTTATMRSTVTGTSAVDSGVPDGTWHYRVVARDAAGNTSLPSDQATARVSTSPPTVISVSASADTFGNQSAATTNYGASSSLASRGTVPGQVAYLRFSLPTAPTGKSLTGVTLRLRTKSESVAGSIAAIPVRLAGNEWTETQLTWNNRPALAGQVGTVPATKSNTATSAALALASLEPLTGTTITLAVASTSSDNLLFWSRHHTTASYRPRLVLTFG